MNNKIIVLAIALVSIITFSSCSKYKVKHSGCEEGMTVITKNYNTDSVAFYFPTAFTPDYDQINDEFGLFSTGIISMEITIKKGLITVYSSKDINETWDGKYKQKEAKHGIYKYKATLVSKYNETIEVKGEITLIKCSCDNSDVRFKSIPNNTCVFPDQIHPYNGNIYKTHQYLD